MIRLVTCVTVSCDPCGETALIDDMIAHFDSVTDAEESLTEHGWRFLAGGRVLCRDCTNAHDCEVHGHHWSRWWACRCQGRIGDHLRFLTMAAFLTDACAAEVRTCKRCDADEERPATAIAAGGEA